MQRAIIYARLASNAQLDQRRLGYQLEQCRAVADEMGLTITAEFVDHGISGTTLDRPALHQALDHLANTQTGYLICSQPTVLARKFHLHDVVITHAAAMGTEVVYAASAGVSS